MPPLAYSRKPGIGDASELRLLYKLRLQLHRADAVDPAVDVVIAFNQFDALDLGAYFHHQRGAFDFQVLDHGHGIAVSQPIAMYIADVKAFVGRFSGRTG